MKRKDTVKILALVGLCICFFCIKVGASDPLDMPDGFSDVTDSLPDEIKDALPQDMMDGDGAAEGLREILSLENISKLLTDALGAGSSSALRLACVLIGLIVLSALTRAVISSAESSSLSGAFQMCSSLAVFAAVIGAAVSQLNACVGLLSSLSRLMESVIPVTGIIWAMGGNIGTAGVGSATLYTFLAVCESLCAKSVLPVCLMLTVTALCSAISPDMKLGGISGAVKKSYNFILGLVMTLLVAVLGMQTTLSSASDGIGAKTAKLVTSTVIPVVGGSVGDTLKSVAGSVEYIKSVFGISAIVFIVFLVAPTLISVLLSRAAFALAGGVADALGCEQESRLLGEMGNIYGCMLGVLSMSSVMFILGLAIFVKSTVAIA